MRRMVVVDAVAVSFPLLPVCNHGFDSTVSLCFFVLFSEFSDLMILSVYLLSPIYVVVFRFRHTHPFRVL